MADDRIDRWLKAGREGLATIEQEFVDGVVGAIRSGVVEPERRIDPMTGRRAPRDALSGNRAIQRVHTFHECCGLLDRLDPQDRDVVVRRLRAYYCTPEPAPDADERTA